MKKLVISVLLGFLVGFAYIAIMMLVSTPFLLLFKMGLLDISTGITAVDAVISNITGSLKDITGNISTIAVVIIIIQCILFLTLSFVSFMFLKKVMEVFLADDEYFRHLYEIVFAILMFIPEILIILSLFFHFPVGITIFIILGITLIISIFSTTMAGKVLPDLMKHKESKYLLKTNIKN